MTPYIIYAVLCVLVAFYGRGTRLGFWGVLLLSVLVTPLVVVIGLVLLAPFQANILTPFRNKRLS
jgi:uncharacterized membrane protein YhaH (DUF805 family)